MCALATYLVRVGPWPGEACRFGQGSSVALGFGVATSTSLAALITGIWHIVLISVVQGLGVYTPAEPVTTYEERSCLQH
jgi:hypothetical protein